MSIRAEHLSFSYTPDRPLLRDISFEAKSGQITALVGANGAGKTTLLKCLLGALPYSGKCTLSDPESLGYLTQDSRALPSLTVLECVLLGRLRTLGLCVRPEDTEAVWRILETLHIEHLAERSYARLSGGERRMVNLAQVLVRFPSLLLLDEPTANLDLQRELELMTLVKAYTDQRQATTLVILHDLSMACRFADQVVLLNHGRVLEAGPPQEVLTAALIQEAYGVVAELIPIENKELLLHVKRSVRESHYDFSDD